MLEIWSNLQPDAFVESTKSYNLLDGLELHPYPLFIGSFAVKIITDFRNETETSFQHLI